MDSVRYVGMDVHKETIDCSVMDGCLASTINSHGRQLFLPIWIPAYLRGGWGEARKILLRLQPTFLPFDSVY